MFQASKVAIVGLAFGAFLAPAFAAPAQEAVDRTFEQIAAGVSRAGLEPVVDIDHARLAAEAGVEMPPSRVQLFSDAAVNSALLAQDLSTGLDLPFRALTYAGADAVQVIYTSGDFLKRRYGLGDTEVLAAFDAALAPALDGLDGVEPVPVPTEGLADGTGILTLQSPHDVAETVARLRAIVAAQSDTVWFGEVDFTAEAAALGVDLPPAVLLLFGGPAPGGVAMAKFPSIGVDAFCQKLFVHAAPEGGSVVLFNSIVALAELHYGTSAPPHAMLDERLTATFAKALE
ncbi:DUF302 domain-containing protein [Ruegeria pomeroyi]|uniref:DUF302 domain-containing protein n=1 Tax=Ruegeria pomeroyi TaxID=89184 RepID=UPI001F3F4E6C|nr:DUF302 domain-containing protein [Ruegeria pomeroyi]MCE8508664.1 DUF302 domain-containing protein [Ruegeria pomeroyi]